MYYNWKETGIRVKNLRKERNMTQRELSECIGMAVNSVAKIENGAVGTSIDTLLVLCEEFDTDLDYLICGKQHREDEVTGLIKDIPGDKLELSLKILKGILCNL